MSGEEGELEEGLVPASYVRMKARDAVLLAFERFPVSNVVELLVANASPEHTLLATKELAYRAADAANCEEIYEAGGISALADLVLEEDLHVKIEALNALINLAVDEQSRMDLSEAGVVMLAVALLQHPSPLVQFKTCNLLINLTSLDEAKEKVREEQGIPALLAVLRSTNERVRLMAAKALHNVLFGCVPYANHAAVLEAPGALVALMKLLLTSKDARVLQYLLRFLGLLLQYDAAVRAFCESLKGPKMLLVLAKRNAEDPLLLVLVLRLLKVVSTQDGLEALQMVDRMLAIWAANRQQPDVAVACLRTLLTLTDKEEHRRQFLAAGLPPLVEALAAGGQEEQAAGAALVARLAQDGPSAAALLEAGALAALLGMLGTKSVKAVHHALSAAAHLLGMADGEAEGMQPLHESTGLLLKYSLSRHKQIQLKALLLLQVSAQTKAGCEWLARENVMAVLFKVLPDWTEKAQLSLLELACASLQDPGCVAQVMKSGKLKYVSSFLVGKQSEDAVKVALATATHALLSKLKEQRAAQRASLGPSGLTPVLGRRGELSSPSPSPSPTPAPAAEVEAAPTLEEGRLLDTSREAAAAALPDRPFVAIEPVVEVPTADGQQTLIDKLAALVAAKGPNVEAQALQKHSQNPRFAFLVAGAGAEWAYYLSRVSAAQVEKGGAEDERFTSWKRERTEEQRKRHEAEEEERVTAEVERRERENERVRKEYEVELKAYNERKAEKEREREEEREREKLEKERELARMEEELRRQEEALKEEERELERKREEERKRAEEEERKRRAEEEERMRALAEEERRLAEEEAAMEEERQALEREERERAERERDEKEREEREREEKEREEKEREERERVKGLSELDAAMMELEGLMDGEEFAFEEDTEGEGENTQSDSIPPSLSSLSPPETETERKRETETTTETTAEIETEITTESVTGGESADALLEAMAEFDSLSGTLLSVPRATADPCDVDALSGLLPANATAEEVRESQRPSLAPSATELPTVSESDVLQLSSADIAAVSVAELATAEKERETVRDISERTTETTERERETEKERETESESSEAEEAEDLETVGVAESREELPTVSPEAFVAATAAAPDVLESAVVLQAPTEAAPLPPSGGDSATAPQSVTETKTETEPKTETETESETELERKIEAETTAESERETELKTETTAVAPSVAVTAPVSPAPATAAAAQVQVPASPSLAPLSSSGKKVIVRCSWDDDVRTVRATNDMSMAELAAVVAAKYRREAAALLACTVKYREMEDLVLLESDDDLEMAFELCESRLELNVVSPPETATESNSVSPYVVPTVSAPAPPPPAPAPPPPPPSGAGLKKRPAKKSESAAASGGALASDKSARPGRKKGKSGAKRMSLFEEMESKRTALKRADRDLSNMTIRRRKVAPRQADSSDMLSVMMQALDARRQHIATPDLDDLPDDDEDWD